MIEKSGKSPFEKPVEELKRKEPSLVAEAATVGWMDNGDGTGTFTVQVLNGEIRIYYPEISIEASDTVNRFTLKLLSIMYLVGADGGSGLSGEWIAYRDVPEGRFYEPVVMRSTEDPLADLYGSDLESFSTAAGKLGGIRQEFGDISYSFALFPKVHYCVIIWKGDDEFPARARVLLDSNSSRHLGAFELRMGAEEIYKLLKNA